MHSTSSQDQHANFAFLYLLFFYPNHFCDFTIQWLELLVWLALMIPKWKRWSVFHSLALVNIASATSGSWYKQLYIIIGYISTFCQDCLEPVDSFKFWMNEVLLHLVLVKKKLLIIWDQILSFNDSLNPKLLLIMTLLVHCTSSTLNCHFSSRSLEICANSRR